MRIGLLECDHVNDSLRHIAGDYRDMFTKLFAHHAPEIELTFFDTRNGILPDSIEDCDGYLTTGSRFSALDDEPWINELKSFIREAAGREWPFVGICFGHQVMAEAMGGSVSRVEWGIGAHPTNIKHTEFWMIPKAGSCSLLYSHRDQVVELPDHAVVVAEAGHCPFAMFSLGERMIGIQGHPEFPLEYLEALVRSRTAIIGEEKVSAADFRSETDSALAGRWIANFLAV